MSNVTLIVMSAGTMRITQAHWRTVKLLLQHGFKGVHWASQPWVSETDAGYILLDYGQKVLINAQNAFDLTQIKGWDVIRFV